MGRALTILLEPLSPQEREWIATYEANLNRLRYPSALALGPVRPGDQLHAGAGENGALVRIAHQEALDNCGGLGRREACRVVYTSGKLDGPAFVQAVQAGMANDLQAYQAAWRSELAKLQQKPNHPKR